MRTAECAPFFVTILCNTLTKNSSSVNTRGFAYSVEKQIGGNNCQVLAQYYATDITTMDGCSQGHFGPEFFSVTG